jgi:hypothetical protein
MSCAARYQETPSFEFILNPFKFFFTNYVKKTRQTEYGQASLVDAVSVTYNLRPLATIEARINAAFPALVQDTLHATYLKLRLRARLRTASTSIICSRVRGVVVCKPRSIGPLPHRPAPRFRHLRKLIGCAPCAATHCGAP